MVLQHRGSLSAIRPTTSRGTLMDTHQTSPPIVLYLPGGGPFWDPHPLSHSSYQSDRDPNAEDGEVELVDVARALGLGGGLSGA